ncbi:unnamed protein product, partial [Laminaria digitata]
EHVRTARANSQVPCSLCYVQSRNIPLGRTLSAKFEHHSATSELGKFIFTQPHSNLQTVQYAVFFGVRARSFAPKNLQTQPVHITPVTGDVKVIVLNAGTEC